MITISFALLHLFFASMNPFELPFEDKKELTQEDIVEIQSLLKEVDLKPKLSELYPLESPWFDRLKPLQEIERRATRCLKQVLIDPKKGLFPEVGLIEINEGGGDCFVVSCPLNGPYKELLKELIMGLQEVGFNGHVYYRIGGVANPTGKEAKWVGVPYAFKIFTMMEAHNLGFNHLIWLDSSLFPLKNPRTLFEKLHNDGAVVLHRSHPTGYILPTTKAVIEKMVEVELERVRHVRMWVFGIDMSRPWVKSFLKSYTKMVELGLPFISCYPEEFVISALLDAYKEQIPSLTDPMMSSKQGYNNIVESQDKNSSGHRKAYQKGSIFLIREHG